MSTSTLDGRSSDAVAHVWVTPLSQNEWGLVSMEPGHEFVRIRIRTGTLQYKGTSLMTSVVATGELPGPLSRAADQTKRRCLVADRATLPQKWPPSPRNVVDSCELTETT